VSPPPFYSTNGKATSGVINGVILTKDASERIAHIACSLEVRRRREGELPLRGFFVAQESGTPLRLGLYRLRLEGGQETMVQIDHLTPLTVSSRQMGSFEILD
jgi:hypothetical protein